MRRSGFSLLELVVAIAIIAILIALLLPAVQYSREAARRVQCASNLRQIALAVHQYEGQHRSFPPGNAQGYSYLVAILPQMEMEPIYNRFDYAKYSYDLDPDFKSYILAVNFPHYRCPSDEVAQKVPYRTNYPGNMGYDYITLGKNGIFDCDNVANPNAPGAVVRMGDVADGLSGTVMIGERLVGDGVAKSRLRTNWTTALQFGPGQHEQFCSACLAHQYKVYPPGTSIAYGYGHRGTWFVGFAGDTLYTHSLPPNNESCDNGGSITEGIYTLGSNHPRGAQAVFADAHIEFIAESIDRELWRSRGTRAGNEAN